MSILDTIHAFYQSARSWLRGRPSFILSMILLAEAALLVWAALRWKPESKAALVAWVTLP